MKHIAVFVVAFLVGFAIAVLPTLAQTASFTESFTGAPPAPLSMHPSGWDILASAGPGGAFPSDMHADHGADCSAPPVVPDPLPPQPNPPDTPLDWPALPSYQHVVNNAADAVYQCNNHLMTAIFNGYGFVYMTPPAMLDFSQGAATLDWNMSTHRTASRDWVDVVIMPFSENMEINFQDNHVPNNSVHIFLGGTNEFNVEITRGAYASPTWSGSCGDVPQPTTCRLGFSGLHGRDGSNNWEDVLQDYGLSVSAARRDHFQIVLSPTHIKVGMPDYSASNGQPFTWIDSDINPPLTWNKGIVQLNHRSYNPMKSCENPTYPQSQELDAAGDVDNPYGATFCPPNTWHWDEVRVNPSAPFTIIPATPSEVRTSTTHAVTFAAPAPAGAFLHAAGNPSPTNVSFDGGATWQLLPTVGQNNDAHPETSNSYWLAVPQGVTSAMFSGSNSGSLEWTVTDISLWSQGADPSFTPLPFATNTPLPTVVIASNTATATSTPTAVAATRTATPQPSVTPTAVPSATATPAATGTAVVTCRVSVEINGTPGPYKAC